MKAVYKREDGYTEYKYKTFQISYFQGKYEVQDWFRDNEFHSAVDVKKAIDEEITGGNPFK